MNSHNVMKTRLIRIGSSRGIRIPERWLKKLQIEEHAELALEGDRMIIRRARKNREGWEAQFRAMAKRGDDRLIEGFPPTQWDETEWE